MITESDPNFEDETKTPCLNDCGEMCEGDYCNEKCWENSNN